MAIINLGADPMKDQGMGDLTIKPTGAAPADPKSADKLNIGMSAATTSSAAPDSISINFTPSISAVDPGKPAAATAGPQLVNLEIKRADLGKPETAPMTKPSTAWGGALDVSKDTKPVVPAASLNLDKPASAPAAVTLATAAAAKPGDKTGTEKNEFFASAALQEKAGTSKLVENIATQKAKLEQPKMEELLGKKSTILEKSIEQEALLKMKKKLRFMQFIAFFITVVVVAVNGFLYYQISPGLNVFGMSFNFDSNLRNDVFNVNQSLRSQQTDLNKYRFLSGQLYLNQFGYESTRFIDGLANLETPGLASDKVNLESSVDEAKTKMPELLAGAQNNLTQPISVETYFTRGETAVDATTAEADFQKELLTAINADKTALQAASSQNKEEVPADQLAFYDNTLKLVGNQKLVTNLSSMTVDAFKLEAEDYRTNTDPAQRIGFKTYIDNLLASTKVNLATITNLRNSRVRLSEVIDAVERITNQVNTEHNSGLGSANASSIVYSDFQFNSDGNTISINARNITNSGTNREVVTYLIEAFEASPEFRNVSNRTFPLNKSTDANGSVQYEMGFKMDMSLESGAFSKMNSPIVDLQNGQKVAQIKKIPVKIKK